MVFKAKNGPKRPELWFWPMPRTSMHPLKAVGRRSLPIFGSSGFEKILQARQGRCDVTKFHGKSNIPNDFDFFFIFAQWVRGPQLVLYKWV